MKTVANAAAQGELYLVRVDSVPAAFTKRTNGELIVGHSESGHHHVIRDGVTMFDAEPADPTLCYLQVDETIHGPAALEHLKSGPHVHPTLLLLPGATYRVRRAREESSAPEGWAVARD